MPVAFRVSYSTPSGDIQGERVLPQLPIRFGRNALNQCQIVHGTISDFHAVVELIDGKLCMRDLKSKNGVHLPTGERIAADMPTPFDTAGECSFVLAGLIRVKIEPFAQEVQVGQRASEAHGSVLGNRAMLMQSGVGHPSDPAFSRTPLPPRGASFVIQPPMVDHAVVPAPGAAGYLPPLPAAPMAAAAPRPAQHASPQPDQDSRSTHQLNLSVEDMATLGLKELAASLVPGVPLQTTGDVARLLTKLHDTVEVFCRCYVPLREGYAQFMSSMDLQRASSQRSLNRSKTALRVEEARDPAALAAALLDWRSKDFDAPQVVEAILADLMMHQLALVDGFMRGVHALLEELSPERIERLFEEQGAGGVSAMLGRHRALWQTFAAHHEELQNETRLFEVVFGQDFAQSYREYLSRRGGATR
jgi:type VI secretion system protein ImpI